jgi:plastocyanin
MRLRAHNRRWLPLIPALALVAFGSACSTSSTENAPVGAEAPGTAGATAAVAGDAGLHTVTGMLPPAVGGFPSIVILERPTAGDDDDKAAATPVMDQVQQTYTPAVLMVRTGQPVEFRNSDEVLHNVRVREDATHSPSFNVAIPTGEKYTFTFPRDGFYDVGCDIHPGMAAQIVSTRSPFAAVAAADGTYSIADVPAGTYTAVVYTGSARIEREVTIDGGQTRLDVSP